MSRAGYLTCFVSFGILSLLTSMLIRFRLKKCHSDLFARMGSPAFQDSNLGKTYWKFQKFVLWGYRSYGGPLRLLFEIGGEADGSALRRWRLRMHQLTDRRQDGADGAVLFGEFFIQPRFELREAPSQLSVRTQ